jgi:hypothetical protein
MLATCFHTGFVLGLIFNLQSMHCDKYSTLNMEAIYSSESSVDFERTTRRYIPEDSTV